MDQGPYHSLFATRYSPGLIEINDPAAGPLDKPIESLLKQAFRRAAQ